MAEISILLKKETILAYGFTKFKIQRVVNLFEDTGSVGELKYPDRVLVLYGRIKASSIINYVQMLSLTL
jgi:hypothetical protein